MATRAMSGRSYLSIGDVLSLLREEFPDVTISKIRFLESQGLVDPERSPSGYRKFYDEDVARLRWVLRKQRDQFLPLKIIRDRLAAAGNGVPPDDEPDTNGQLAGHDDENLGASEGFESAPAAVGAGSIGRGAPPAGVAALSHPSGAAGAPAGLSAVGRASTAGGTATGVGRATGAYAGEPNGAQDPQSRNGVRDARPLGAESRPGSPEDAGAAAALAAVPTARAERFADPGPDAVPASNLTRSATGRPGRQEQSMASTQPRSAAADTGAAAPDRQGAASKAADVLSPSVSGVSLTLAELCAATGLTTDGVSSLESLGLLSPMTIAGGNFYDEEALTVGKLVVEFRRYGVEPRHLRMYHNAVVREVGVVEQVITPLLRQRNPEARQRAVDSAADLARLGQSMRASLMRAELRRQLGT